MRGLTPRRSWLDTFGSITCSAGVSSRVRTILTTAPSSQDAARTQARTASNRERSLLTAENILPQLDERLACGARRHRLQGAARPLDVFLGPAHRERDRVL